MRLTLNISPCPNDTFMFEALINGRIDTRGYEFDVAFADIEELNRRVMSGGEGAHGTSGTPDEPGTSAPAVSKISYAVLPAIHDSYTLLDSGSALGHGNGPVLVCRKSDKNDPPHQFFDSLLSEGRLCNAVDGDCEGAYRMYVTERSSRQRPQSRRYHDKPRVAIPGVHTTANLLLQKLFPELTDRRPMLFSDIAPAIARGDADAGVLIHEGRFTYRDHDLELVADLGVEWDRATGGLPLPLGAIVASRTLTSGVIRDVEEMIRESIEYGFANPEASREFIKAHAQEMDDAVIDNHITLFVNDNSLTLGPEARRAVKALTGIC